MVSSYQSTIYSYPVLVGLRSSNEDEPHIHKDIYIYILHAYTHTYIHTCIHIHAPANLRYRARTNCTQPCVIVFPCCPWLRMFLILHTWQRYEGTFSRGGIRGVGALVLPSGDCLHGTFQVCVGGVRHVVGVLGGEY